MGDTIRRVYKFYPQRWALEAIQRERLKISTLGELNDPFEFFAVNMKNREHRTAIKKMKTELGKTKGLISFSGGWENPVLWSHYADSHQGIALGFDVSDEHLKEVSYTEERINFPNFDLLDEHFTSKLNSTKFKHWDYENEYRMWVELRLTDPVTELYFKDFDNQIVLKEIVLGAEYVPRGAKKWSKQLQDSGIKIITARLEFGKFRVREQGAKNLWKTL